MPYEHHWQKSKELIKEKNKRGCPMSVPDFQSFFKPLLEIAADGKEHTLKEARGKIGSIFNLSEEDLNELLPSGTQKKFDNRMA